MKFKSLALVVTLSALFFVSSLSFQVSGQSCGIFCSSTIASFSMNGSGNAAPLWVSAGAYVNYSLSGNAGFTLKLSNGSSESLSLTISGTEKATVNSVSQGYANVTTVTNGVFTETYHYFNLTSRTQSEAATPANSTTTSLIPLSELSFGSVSQNFMNVANNSYFFSPNLNASLSSSPGVIYQWNGQNVVAMHLSSTVSASQSIPATEGISGSYTVSGSYDLYTTVAQNIPLQASLNLQGSATVNNMQLGLNQQITGATASGNAQFTVNLLSSNIDFTVGNAQQGTVSVPSLSSSLDVISNSTISGLGTNGNKLIINVTGPSGSIGVTDVEVTQSMLNKAGITDASQVSVTLDGQSYSNYTLTNVGGIYIYTIYYHHSSHSVALGFANANLGTNQGTVSSVSAAPATILGLSLDMFIAAIVVVIVVVVGLGYFFMRGRRHAQGAVAGSPTPPVQA